MGRGGGVICREGNEEGPRRSRREGNGEGGVKRKGMRGEEGKGCSVI